MLSNLKINSRKRRRSTLTFLTPLLSLLLSLHALLGGIYLLLVLLLLLLLLSLHIPNLALLCILAKWMRCSLRSTRLRARLNLLQGVDRSLCIGSESVIQMLNRALGGDGVV